MESTESNIKKLVGQTLTQKIELDNYHNTILKLYDENHNTYLFNNVSDCCNDSFLESGIDDLLDICMSEEKIIVAEERTPDIHTTSPSFESRIQESETWTFYTLRTIKHTATLRFCSTSNGYYCEEIEIVVIPKNKK